MKKVTKNGTYNTDSAKLLRSATFADGNAGRDAFEVLRGKARGKIFLAEWRHPFGRYVAIKIIDKSELNNYIWDYIAE